MIAMHRILISLEEGKARVSMGIHHLETRKDTDLWAVYECIIVHHIASSAHRFMFDPRSPEHIRHSIGQMVNLQGKAKYPVNQAALAIISGDVDQC